MAASTISTADLAEVAERYAAYLALPGPPRDDEPWTPQSLTKGAAGIALLHIERAHAGCGTWQQAHTWIKNAVADQISATDNTSLYLGAPAITLMLD
ncbi:MAG: lanthionine synthetase, partial [Pseudonocardiaceae bacterium]